MPVQNQAPQTVEYTEFDTAPDLIVRLDDGDGNPIGLTGNMVTIDVAFVTYSDYYAPQGRIIADGVCVPDPDQVGHKGEVSWTPPEGALTPAGSFGYRFKITYGDGRVQHVPPRTWLPLSITTRLGGAT